jgi:surface protein
MKRLLLILVTMTACVAAWAAEGYAVFTQSNKTLTFYYGNKPEGAYSLNYGLTDPLWYMAGNSAVITHVVFDPSFAQARPTTTDYWFYDMEDLTSITGLNYLNTSEVTSMHGMFSECRKLTSLDLSGFNTAKVTDMGFMLSLCENLTSLDLSSFNTANVISMFAMFWDCKNLTSLDLRNFNTANVINMEGMFFGCQLTSLDLSSFNTANVTNMKNMFENCDELKTITVGSTWSTEAVTISTDMFANCFKIVGGAGTTYSSSYTDASYAHIDGGPSNPGYLTGATYDLWINGVQVTCANQNGVTGSGISGSVTYDPSTNTLTLNNATIDQGGLSVVAISTAYGSPANFKIKLVGDNKILANFNSIAINAKESQGFTLYGSGTLDCGGALYLDAHDHLTDHATVSYIKDCSVHFDNILSEGYEECLTIDNADVTTEYLSVGNDHNGYKGLNLVNCYVASPANGVVGDGCIMVNGQDWQGHIEIKRSGVAGDVNGDGKVNVSDVTALINMILGITPMNETLADVNGDGRVNVSDVTALINIILGIH